MRALSVKEPWAGMIRSGMKTIETRTWPTRLRERVLLCASQRPAGALSGLAFATAVIADCREMSMDDEAAACCSAYRGAYAWVLEDVRLIVPFPVKGMLGFFQVDDALIKEVER